MKLLREINNAETIKSAISVYKYLSEFKTEDREHFIVIGLDTRNKPIYREIVTIGTLNASLIHPREVFKKAIMMSANALIVAHNHPSGDTAPSDEDKDITRILIKAGELLQIKILDHVIIGDDYFSFQENNLI